MSEFVKVTKAGSRDLAPQAVVLLNPLTGEVDFPLGAVSVIQSSDYPGGALPVNASSGNVASPTAAVAVMAAVPGKVNYLTGVSITGTGATAAGVKLVTITGLIGGTLTFVLAVPAGVTTAHPGLRVEFSKPLVASAANTPITVTCPDLGTGSTNNVANIWGYVL